MYEFLRKFLKDVINLKDLVLVKFLFDIHIFQGIPVEFQRLSARLSMSFRKILFFEILYSQQANYTSAPQFLLAWKRRADGSNGRGVR